MKRLLLFLLKLAVLVAAAIWLVNRPGRVEIAWQGYVVEFPFGLLVLAGLALVVAAALLYRAWRAMVRTPRRIARSRQRARRERGYRALTQGMVAVAAGDAEAARRYARRADVLLNEPPLTMLLAAQTAQLNGDEGAAARYFQAMLERPETQFLGLRGLLMQALRRNDPVAALGLARRARELRPGTPWVLRASFDLEARLRRWPEAQDSLGLAVKGGVIDPATGNHHAAAILIERSREAEAAGRFEEALSHAHRAAVLLPDFAPAVGREASLLARTGKPGRAVRLIETAWARRPHRLLAEAYGALGPEGEDPLARVKRLERLVRLAPDAAPGHIALGQAAQQAQLWGAARSHLLRAEQLAPDRRGYRLLADLEQAERHDAEAARAWLVKAEEAPEEEAWVCAHCGHVAQLWTALCPRCDAFDNLEWRRPTVAVHLPPLPRPSLLPTTPPPPGALPVPVAQPA